MVAKGLDVSKKLEKTIAALKETRILPSAIPLKKSQGKVNEVTQYREGFFKPDQDLKTKLIERIFGTAHASGIPLDENAHLPARAVASSLVDRLLYGTAPISVSTRYAVVEGQRGILMDVALGKSPKVLGEREVDHNDPVVKKLFAIEPLDLNAIAALLGVDRVYSKPDGTGYLYKVYESFSPDNVTTAEGLLKLQVLDWICGQVDRHAGNYFINETGEVTGIDQDCSFGVNSVPKDVDVRQQPHLIGTRLIGLVPNMGSLMLRMPSVVTESVKESIKKLYNNQTALAEMLDSYITSDEIRETLRRLKMLYEHVNTTYVPPDPATNSLSKGCVVVQTQDELLELGRQGYYRPEEERVINADNSYWAREVYKFKAGEANLNYLRENRRGKNL
jgi:hypothetical protein